MMTQNESKHTPGPWEVRLSKGSWNEHHAVICTPDYPSTVGSYVADITHGMSDAVRNANAQLIAAAPELLEALRLCAQVLNRGNREAPSFINIDGAFFAARAAIAKATGQAVAS